MRRLRNRRAWSEVLALVAVGGGGVDGAVGERLQLPGGLVGVALAPGL